MMFRFSHSVYRLAASARHGVRQLTFWLGAVAVGLAALAMAQGSVYAHSFIHWLAGVSPLLPLALTPAGLALSALITRKFFPSAQGSGIPQVIATLQIEEHGARRLLLSFRIAFAKIGLTLLGLFSGASIGREGPTVQVGASLLFSAGRFLGPGARRHERALILAGGAAGVAAAFNTPLAGIVFAIEELSRSFEQKASGTVITAVILAGMTTLAFDGNYTYFGHTGSELAAASDWLAVPLCGVVGGVMGGLYSRIVLRVGRGLPGATGAFLRNRPVAAAAVCGLLLALAGLASGSTTYCTGYDETRQLLDGSGGIPMSFGLLKMFSSIVSVASGVPGGLFAPSLAVGAGLGQNLSLLLPHVQSAAVIVLSIVSYFSGVVQAPITAFVIVAEMTDNHDMIIPLMASALIAERVSKLICRKPLYKAMSERFVAKIPAPDAGGAGPHQQ